MDSLKNIKDFLIGCFKNQYFSIATIKIDGINVDGFDIAIESNNETNVYRVTVINKLITNSNYIKNSR